MFQCARVLCERESRDDESSAGCEQAVCAGLFLCVMSVAGVALGLSSSSSAVHTWAQTQLLSFSPRKV